MNKHGVDSANREIGDLAWYINTGRACPEFLRKLFAQKPFVIGRILHKGGSTEEVINNIKRRLRFK
jgi:hypothetical protein